MNYIVVDTKGEELFRVNQPAGYSASPAKHEFITGQSRAYMVLAVVRPLKPLMIDDGKDIRGPQSLPRVVVQEVDLAEVPGLRQIMADTAASREE